MPAENRIAVAMHAFRQNTNQLEKSFSDLRREEWLRRPAEGSNPVLWIVGHLVWARSRVLATLGEEWTRPWLPLFARGAALDADSAYPSPDEIMTAWHDVTLHLTASLDAAPADALAAPVGERSPSYDGTVAGMVTFLAVHETYHVGQVAYLRRWLGHDGVVG
jgi:uncharacterized damage-inducible protein DinB